MNASMRNRFVRVVRSPEEGSAVAPDMFKEFGIGGSTSEETTTTEEIIQEETKTTEETQTQTEENQTKEVDEATTLREQISRMASVMASHGITLDDVVQTQQQQTQGTEAQTQQTTLQTQTPQTPQWGPVVEITDEDFADAVENKASFQKILTQVRDQAVERTVQSIPQLVVSMVKQQLYLSELAREFYQANEDLAGVRPFVGVVANEIASKNPGWTPEQVMTETATAVRSRLAMKGKAQESTTQKQNPGLPNTTTRPRATAPQLSGLEAELASMMKTAREQGV